MTEDYIRRSLPANFPVIYHKLKTESYIDLKQNCENLCINNFTTNTLDRSETNCLQRCFRKSLEFDAYFAHEYERLFIDEVKKFNRREGV